MLDFPASPTLNQQFSAAGSSWVFDGTAWNIVPQMVPAVASDTPPANPAVGQFWWRASNGQLYLWYDDGNSKQWVQAAAPAQAPVTPARAWELIQTSDMAGKNATTFLNLGAFQTLRLTGVLQPVSATPLYLRTSSNNGSSFDQAATDYFNQNWVGSGVTTTASSSNISLAVISSSNLTYAGFETLLLNFNKAIQCNMSSRVAGNVASGLTAEINTGMRAGAARNALQFTGNGVVMTSGTLILEGVRG